MTEKIISFFQLLGFSLKWHIIETVAITSKEIISKIESEDKHETIKLIFSFPSTEQFSNAVCAVITKERIRFGEINILWCINNGIDLRQINFESSDIIIDKTRYTFKNEEKEFIKFVKRIAEFLEREIFLKI